MPARSRGLPWNDESLIPMGEPNDRCALEPERGRDVRQRVLAGLRIQEMRTGDVA